mmetsp:Transcript_31441/g.98634  ORF Transcript_31441/g.98634 Transcript_31441/m.98634 type:complete len:275 (-) Transcript_31441:21-845(-)
MPSGPILAHLEGLTPPVPQPVALRKRKGLPAVVLGLLRVRLLAEEAEVDVAGLAQVLHDLVPVLADVCPHGLLKLLAVPGHVLRQHVNHLAQQPLRRLDMDLPLLRGELCGGDVLVLDLLQELVEVLARAARLTRLRAVKHVARDAALDADDVSLHASLGHRESLGIGPLLGLRAALELLVLLPAAAVIAVSAATIAAIAVLAFAAVTVAVTVPVSALLVAVIPAFAAAAVAAAAAAIAVTIAAAVAVAVAGHPASCGGRWLPAHPPACGRVRP